MPYFPFHDVLLVHIPKTGGTSIERHLVQDAEQRGKVPSHQPGPWFDSKAIQLYTDSYRGPGVSPQHQSLTTLLGGMCPRYRRETTAIIAVVRNPYARAVSELVWRRFVTSATPPPVVFKRLQECIRENRDAHMTPQWRFITDTDGRINDRVHVMRTETLTDDMHAAGYSDYQGPTGARSWEHLLGPQSIHLINTVYKKDFELFGYPIVGWSRAAPTPH